MRPAWDTRQDLVLRKKYSQVGMGSQAVKMDTNKLEMVAHAFNPTTQEAEVG